MTTGEHRRSRRVTYYAEALLEGLDSRGSEARVSDLSVNGAFIDTRMVLAAGTVTKLTFRIRDREITVTVEVRYAIPEIGMGVRFLNLSPEDGVLIEEVIGAQTEPSPSGSA